MPDTDERLWFGQLEWKKKNKHNLWTIANEVKLKTIFEQKVTGSPAVYKQYNVHISLWANNERYCTQRRIDGRKRIIRRVRVSITYLLRQCFHVRTVNVYTTQHKRRTVRLFYVGSTHSRRHLESSQARRWTGCARVALPRRRSVWRQLYRVKGPDEKRAQKRLVHTSSAFLNIRRCFLVRNVFF